MRGQGKLTEVDGMASMDAVAEAIDGALQAVFGLKQLRGAPIAPSVLFLRVL